MEINTNAETQKGVSSYIKMNNNNELEGIGGWLILPVLGIILTPMKMGYALATIFAPLLSNNTWKILTTPGNEAYHHLWAPLLIFEVTGNICFTIFPIILLILLIKKHYTVPRFFIIFYAANVLFLIADFLLADLIPFIAEQNNHENLNEIIRSLIAAAVWIPYFLNSKRVKNTFINGRDKQSTTVRTM